MAKVVKLEDFEHIPEELKTSRFPAIANFIGQNNLSLRKFAKLIDVSPSTVLRILQGELDVKKSSIDKILMVTKMDYEDAFAELTEKEFSKVNAMKLF